MVDCHVAPLLAMTLLFTLLDKKLHMYYIAHDPPCEHQHEVCPKGVAMVAEAAQTLKPRCRRSPHRKHRQSIRHRYYQKRIIQKSLPEPKMQQMMTRPLNAARGAVEPRQIVEHTFGEPYRLLIPLGVEEEEYGSRCQ